MKRLLLTCLCLGALIAALCLPAHARLAVGIAPGTLTSRGESAALDRLGQHLSGTMSTDVALRRFEDSDALANWLLRFMELDAALVETGFISSFPAGTFERLADLHPQNKGQGPFALIVRRTHDPAQAEALSKAVLSLNDDTPGRRLLDQLAIEGVTLPGEKPKKRAAKVTQPAQAEAVPPRLPTAPPLPATQPSQLASPPPSKATAEAPDTKPLSPAQDKAAEEPPPQASEPADQKLLPQPVIPEAPKAVAPETVGSADNKGSTSVQEAPRTTQEKSQETAKIPTKQPTNKRLVLFAGLLILAAILLKATLIAMRWRLKKQERQTLTEAPSSTPFAPSPAPAEEPVERQSATEQPFLEAEQNGENLIVESGRLGPGKVPALLKRCADLPKPVVMRVWKGSCEKLVFFAGGKVAGALTQNTDETDAAKRWKKLGSLLVREALITSDELDQGLELLDRQPESRLGEALLKLGHIDLNRLRPALTRQAKVTLYSMILFPEGNYEVIAGDGQIPPEESVALDINALIREAATHQAEWTTIRQTLPKLSMILDFTPNGRNKVKNVNLSPLQESILELINGQRNIIGLCSESAMMDYEVYRFLYMMLKAGVLEKRAA